jgi:NADH:ubiquinone oxidoreductase subunit 5 (subunit L)/multisubunit Na+/H+ antiporter MnhA subunit
MFLTAIISPFLGSFAAGLGGRWIGARGSGLITVLGLGTSAVCSLCVLLEVLVGGVCCCAVVYVVNENSSTPSLRFVAKQFPKCHWKRWSSKQDSKPCK